MEWRAPGYLLHVEPEELDLARFERLWAEARESQAEAAAATLAEALALWRGQPLAEFGYDSFAQGEIARLEELRLGALEERIEADLACGRHAKVVGELEALVAEQPLRERLREQLILALYRCHRQADALEAYRQARQVLIEELGIEPTSALRELEKAILAQDVALDAPVAPAFPPTGEESRSPEPATTATTAKPDRPEAGTPFIGRKREIAQILGLSRTTRLVTLTGAGGSGKTRLALEAAAELNDDYPQRVFWVELASVRDPELLEPTIAQVIGSSNGLAEHLGEQRALLVLDNLEQLLPGVAVMIAALLAEAPHVNVLVTSRERLGIAIEQEYPVPTMVLDEAVALFTARARQLQPGFEPDETLVEISRQLDGLPLAIELAAARVKLLSPEQILARLERRLELLTHGARDAPERHKTLRATIDWSYELLSEGERRLFRRLAVFAGGGTVGAAEEVCEADLNTLSSLIDKGLIGQLHERFTMLETIREYAAERLVEALEADELGGRHAEFFAGLAEEAHAALITPEQATWLHRLEQEHDNLRAALRWSLEGVNPEPGLRLCAALRRFWIPHGHFAEAALWLDLATSRSDATTPSLRGRVLIAAGYLALTRGEKDKARPLLEQALTIARDVGDETTEVDALCSLAILARSGDDLERAVALAEEALSLCRKAGEANPTMILLHQLANFLTEAGDHQRAAELFEESIQFAQVSGDMFSAANTMHSLADLTLDAGDLDRAEELYAESLGLARQFEADWVAAYCLAGLSSVAAARGELERAALLWGAVGSVETGLGIAAMLPSEQTRYTRFVQLACESEPEALAFGRALDLAAAVNYATNAE